MRPRITEEENGIDRTPVPEKYVALFSVPPGSDGFRLVVENPALQEPLRVARVRLGL